LGVDIRIDPSGTELRPVSRTAALGVNTRPRHLSGEYAECHVYSSICHFQRRALRAT
jgi:hypothetical protein